ncbi:MAG: hypothetical protein A4E28_00840 [Methanocella sp. PtaU1.Bin125]|nr:MAG: hypothetical protein A4E28_00840 [Methanocella sp. PtaU1.Bin125]
MVSDENPGDILVNALKFSVSNVTGLAVWGIAFALSIIVMMVIMFSGMILFYDNTLAVIALVLLSYLPALAVSFLLLGFVIQCMKTVIGGGIVMPTGLESPAGLVKDGALTTVILLEAVIVEMICFAPGFLLMFLAAGSESTILIFLAMALMLLAIPFVMVLFFLNMIQWAVYADTGSLLQGLNPLRAVGLIRSNPGGAVIMVVLLIASNIVFSVVLLICELLIITILLLPFLMIAMYAAMAYIVATFYRQSVGDRPEVTRDTASAGYHIT